MEAHTPAEVFPLAEYLAEEIHARGWTTTDVAIRMGGTAEQIAMNLLVIDVILCVHKDTLVIDDKTFDGLARAFGVSADYFRNLDSMWRKWPDRRSPFECPDDIFGPVSLRAMIRPVN